MIRLDRGAPRTLLTVTSPLFLSAWCVWSVCACTTSTSNAPPLPYLPNAGPNDAGSYPLGQGGGPASSTASLDAGTQTATANGTTSGGPEGGPGNGNDAGNDAGMDSGGGGTNCTFTVTGANTASGSCTVTAAYTGSPLNFQVNASSQEFRFTSELSSSSTTLFTGTYTTGNVYDVEGYSSAGAGTWLVAYNYPGISTSQGSFTLDITSTGETFDAGTPSYAPHGTLTMTMPGYAGSTGTATGTATF